MRVAINAQPLREPYTGASRYVYNLLRSLGRVDGITEYRVLSPRLPNTTPETPSTFIWETVPVGRAVRGGDQVERAIWDQHTFPTAAQHADAAIMHIPHFAPPLRTRGVPTVVTIPDVTSLRLPVYRTSPAGRAYMQVLVRAARAARAVITVSDHCKGDIIALLNIPEERIRVIRLAPDTRYHPVLDAVRLRAVRTKYQISERFVLNVGGMDARANLAGLVGAFAAVFHEISDPDLQLFIVGDSRRLGSSPIYPDWRPLAAAFGVVDNVRCACVDENDLPSVYSAAMCFASTSLYEGFGLAPLEAMACGTPLVCSDRTSLPEVVGSAGMLANPEDIESFASVLLRVLTSPNLQENLRARGLARVKQFSWDQVAVETSSLYADITGVTLD